MNQKFEVGQFITFTYKPPAKPPKVPRPTVKKVLQPDGSVQQIVIPPAPVKPEPPSDPTKHVLVLHPNWNNKIHAVDMARITPAEQQVLQSIMDPKVKQAVDSGQWPVEGVPPYPLIRDILRRQDPVELIKNPVSFYNLLIKPFLRGKDAYRQYWPHYVYNVKVVQESKVHGQVMNPKPLFHK